jgi:hypothetical protein
MAQQACHIGNPHTAGTMRVRHALHGRHIAHQRMLGQKERLAKDFCPQTAQFQGNFALILLQIPAETDMVAVMIGDRCDLPQAIPIRLFNDLGIVPALRLAMGQVGEQIQHLRHHRRKTLCVQIGDQ